VANLVAPADDTASTLRVEASDDVATVPTLIGGSRWSFLQASTVQVLRGSSVMVRRGAMVGVACAGPLRPRERASRHHLICLGTGQLGELLAVATRGLRQPVSESTDTLLLFGHLLGPSVRSSR